MVIMYLFRKSYRELHVDRLSSIKFSFFLYYSEKVSHLKILLPCFSSVTHTMWWLPPNFSDGAEFEFAAPSSRPFACRCYWTGRIYPPLHLPPWPGWMNDDVALWWLTDGLLMWWRFRVQRRSQQRRSRKRSRSVEDDEEGHLIYHSGDMLRARCIEYILFFSTVDHTLCLTLLLSGFYF